MLTDEPLGMANYAIPNLYIEVTMGRITPQQIAVQDVLDWLYFNQVLVFSIYSQDDLKCVKRIVDSVISAVTKTGEKGLKAECLKHYVLCLLEIFLSDDDYIDKFKEAGFDTNTEIDSGTYSKVNKYNKDYFGAFVLAFGELGHGEFLSTALEIASDLQKHFCDAPASVRYRLVEHCMAYEFKNSPLYFFIWMLELQVISYSKYKSKNPNSLLDLVITRIGLLCEFEMLRRVMIRNPGMPKSIASSMHEHKYNDIPKSVAEQLNEDSHKFGCLNIYLRNKKYIIFNIDNRLESEYITDFFTKVGLYVHRIRICQGTLASWPGTLGGFLVEMQKPPTKKAIYTELDNNGTITNDVSLFFYEKGFSISGRTLYERHRHFIKKIKNKILLYYITLNQVNAVPPADEDDAPYYSTIILSNRLD